MKISDIPDHVLDDVRKRGIWSDVDIEAMSAEKVFDEYLRWNGIIGFGQDFFEVAITLHKAEKA